MTMSVEKVREYLTPYGVADRMREFEVSSATVELAALAVGVEGARIAKTLSFKVGEDPILIVAAGDAKVDNSKYKHFFGAKAKMLTAEEAVERIGHAVGGVCPFALPDDVKTYLDVSLKRFDTAAANLFWNSSAAVQTTVMLSAPRRRRLISAALASAASRSTAMTRAKRRERWKESTPSPQVRSMHTSPLQLLRVAAASLLDCSKARGAARRFTG